MEVANIYFQLHVHTIEITSKLARHDYCVCGRADWNCNAWTWCDDPTSCTDELLTQIPYRGCQLKWDPHEPWGVPADELTKNFQPSVFTSGYIKSKLPLSSRAFERACSALNNA